MSFALTSSQINTQHVAAGGAPGATGKTPGAGKDEAPRAWVGALAKGLVPKAIREDGVFWPL